jgi:hypothetical protein
VTGSVPSGIPDLDIPIPGDGEVFLLLPAAVGIFLVSFADEISPRGRSPGSMASTCG